LVEPATDRTPSVRPLLGLELGVLFGVELVVHRRSVDLARQLFDPIRRVVILGCARTMVLPVDVGRLQVADELGESLVGRFSFTRRSVSNASYLAERSRRPAALQKRRGVEGDRLVGRTGRMVVLGAKRRRPGGALVTPTSDRERARIGA